MRKIIKAKNIINGIADEVIKDKCIVIEDGLISEIINFENFKPNDDDVIFNYENEFVMPGMVDVHVHLAFSV